MKWWLYLLIYAVGVLVFAIIKKKEDFPPPEFPFWMRVRRMGMFYLGLLIVLPIAFLSQLVGNLVGLGILAFYWPTRKK